MADDLEQDGVAAASVDPILAGELARPATPMDIYLEEVSLYRPIATGDVFRGVPVPGSSDSERAFDLTMVIAHPSAMRRGALLEERARAAPVVPLTGLSKTKWTKGNYDYFPLPLLDAVAQRSGFTVERRGWAACLQLAAPILTRDLQLQNRVACLSPDGIHLLLQRIVHADTRVAVRLETLAAVFKPKLEEIELLETWLEDLADPFIKNGADPASTLMHGTEAFEAFMSEARGEWGQPVRSLLEDPRRSAEGRRLTMTELRKRRVQSSQLDPAEGPDQKTTGVGGGPE